MALIQNDQDLRARLTVQLAAARLRRVKDQDAALHDIAAQAAKSGLIELRLRADLALAESAPARLAELAQKARSLGYGGIARLAERL